MRATRRLILIVSVAAVGLWAKGRWKSSDSPIDRAYWECGVCGLSPSEVDSIINTMHHANLTREQSSDLFARQFARGPDDARDCEPCSVAVLDEAEK